MSNSYSIELPNSGGGSDDGMAAALDFKSLIGILYRRFWLVVAGLLLTFGLIAYVTFTQTPLYKAKSTVQLDTSQTNVIDLGSVLGGIAANTAVIDTEVLVMGSKSLMTRVAKKQNLINEPEFNWTLREEKASILGDVKSTVLGLLGRDTAKPDPFAGLSQEERENEIMESVIGTLQSKTSITRVGTTYLIEAEVTSEDPEMAKRLANAIADEYIVQQLNVKLEATQRATRWLADSLGSLADEVRIKEQAVAEYKAETGTITIDGNPLAAPDLQFLGNQRAQLRQQYDSARSRYNTMRQVSQSGNIDGVPDALKSMLIDNLRAQSAQVSRRVAEMETRYASQHPELISARNELATINDSIKAELNRISRSVELEMNQAYAQLQDVEAAISRTRGELNQNNKDMVKLRELERDAETSRLLYEEFLERSKETARQADLVEADANILSTAALPSAPATPRTLLNLVLGLVLGSAVGVGLALVSEMFDSKISSAEEIERRLGANTIGSVPMIRSQGLLGMGVTNPSDFMVENPLSAYAESIRYLRAAIAFSDLDSETKTVAVTSSLPDEGKTSLTLSLGRMSAMSGSRTLVIDGDFRRRQLTEAAGLAPEMGFIEHLFGAGDLSDAITKDSKSLLDILPLSKSGHTPHDVFGTRAFDELLTRLRSMYDLILIDTGPLLLMAEARVVASKTDKAILVVRWRSSTRSAVKQSLKLLHTFKADILGVTLNMVDLNRRRHHRDPGATYKSYRKYYTMDAKTGLFGGKAKTKKNLPPGLSPMEAPPPRPKVSSEKTSENRAAE